MARKPSVRIKNDRWYSEAGGKGRYYGRIDAVTRDEAMIQLLRVVGVERRPGESPTIEELRFLYLDWVAKNRSKRLHDESARHLLRFCRAVGDKPATEIAGTDLEAFIDGLLAKGMSRAYARKHGVSVRTMFSRGRKAGWLPAGFRPFEAIEQIRVQSSPLLEGDLPTRDEVDRLIEAAEGVLADLIRVYHATGARTHELVEAQVGDFQARTRTLVLGRHKRSTTMRDPVPRTITLNEVAHEIIQRACGDRKPDSPIFRNGAGNAFNARTLATRFANLRKRARVRDEITIYSFRHLWISECLMAGLDAMLVAKMAGTSVAMLESVYGHWRTSAFRDAQAQLDAARAARRH